MKTILSPQYSFQASIWRYKKLIMSNLCVKYLKKIFLKPGSCAQACTPAGRFREPLKYELTINFLPLSALQVPLIISRIIRISLLFFAGFWLLSCNVNAQVEEDDYSLRSPYHTLNTQLNYLSDENYNPEVAAKVINADHHNKKEAIDLTVKIIQIFRGEGININLSDVPREPNYVDSVSGKHRYYISEEFPEIYLERVGNQWYYSEKSLKDIPRIFKSVYPLGIHHLLDLLPKLGSYKIFGLHLWQNIGILFLIIFCVIIHKVFTFLIQRIIVGILRKQGYDEVVNKLVHPVARPISILIIYPILLLLVPVLQLPFSMSHYVMIILKATWPIFATIVVYKVVDIFGLYLYKLAERTESTLDDQLVPIIRKTLKIFVIIVGGMAILKNLNIDIIPLLTGLSIGGLAFALAAQDTIKNFFGSIMIFIDRPFQVGDWITSNDIDGTVEEVGLRATRVRTFRNSLTYVPNARIVDSMVDNHGLRQYRRFYTQIAITYDTPPELIESFVDGLKEIVENHPRTRKDFYNVYLNDMAAHSLNIMFYIFFEVPTWGDELKSRHEVILEIIKLAEALGVRFAFPTQTLHMETFPEKLSNAPGYIRDTGELKSKIAAFFAKNKSDKK